MAAAARGRIDAAGSNAKVGFYYPNKGWLRLRDTRRLFGNHGPTGFVIGEAEDGRAYALFDAAEVVRACERKLAELESESAAPAPSLSPTPTGG